MKYCEKCKLSVNSPVDHCPLCYANLARQSGEPEPLCYPDFSGEAEKYNILFRILLFLSLTICVVCVTINLITFVNIWWCLVVVGNVVYMWAAIGTAVRRRSKIGYNILVQVICLALFLVLLDWFSGHKNWSLNYVVPFLFISATLSITVIIIVRRMALHEFLLYFILTAFLGFIPIILLVFRQVTVLWPSLVSALYSALSLVSLFIFADKATKNELKKRFHV